MPTGGVPMAGASGAKGVTGMSVQGRTGVEAVAEHRTVARVMAILELVVAGDATGVRLADLSGAINAPKSSVHGLAKGLVAEGYLAEGNGRYVLGPGMSALLASGVPNIPALYRPALEQLSERWGETAMLGSLVGDSLVYLDAAEPLGVFIRAVPQIHQRLPLWPRSAGKALLAFQGERQLEGYLRRQHLEMQRPAIREELARVRESRVGVNFGQSGAPHIGIASPIVAANRSVSMTISIAGPESRMAPHLEEITDSVREAAASLSRHVA
jgi:DNA-binding IclR family transcriptional regulator